jgi:hypothetical protein
MQPVREVKWAVARRQEKFFGLVSEWVIDRELSTSPDPVGGTASPSEPHQHADHTDDEQDPSLL